MKTREAVAAVFKVLGNEPVVCATGYLCRWAQASSHRPQNFYMIGSMGMASSIALGAALSKPSKKILALDGDGAVLMNLGSLAMAGSLKPANFVHVVIDNGSYESTGGQPTLTPTVRLENVAKSCGYKSVKRVSSAAALGREVSKALKREGPVFILARVDADASEPPARVSAAPEAITAAFAEALRGR